MPSLITERTMKPAPLKRLQGFALIEAMVAGLVMAFGMLAIIGLQLSLSRNADFAKSRTEATRLAQEQMEELRSYRTIAPSDPSALWAAERAWDNLDSGT